MSVLLKKLARIKNYPSTTAKSPMRWYPIDSYNFCAGTSVFRLRALSCLDFSYRCVWIEVVLHLVGPMIGLAIARSKNNLDFDSIWILKENGVVAWVSCWLSFIKTDYTSWLKDGLEEFVDLLFRVRIESKMIQACTFSVIAVLRIFFVDWAEDDLQFAIGERRVACLTNEAFPAKKRKNHIIKANAFRIIWDVNFDVTYFCHWFGDLSLLGRLRTNEPGAHFLKFSSFDFACDFDQLTNFIL